MDAVHPDDDVLIDDVVICCHPIYGCSYSCHYGFSTAAAAAPRSLLFQGLRFRGGGWGGGWGGGMMTS